MRTKTTQQFIEEAIEIHGDKYDYSLVEYVNNNTYVKIICKIHGEWEQIPKSHLKNYGCYQCGREGLRTSLENFISRSIEIHGDKYDYSLVVYKNSETKIKIICKVHGEFEQKPRQHLVGNGCKKCANENSFKTNQQFIAEAIEIHGDKYDYSLVDYIGCFDLIKIICRTHGEFEQTPSHHLSGSGCKKCMLDKQRKSLDEFMIQATSIHGDKYDYSLVKFSTVKDSVKIICHKHGEFEQSVDQHINSKSGCPKCGKESVTKSKEQFIKDAIKIHGDKYDYSLVEYINNQTYITIICKMHGEFKQSPNSHLQRSGCPFCVNKTEGKIKQFLNQNNISYISQYDIIYGRVDFFIENKYVLEIDGVQHFPKLINKINPRFNDPNFNLKNDIFKMKKIINKYPILRLYQPNIWYDKYDWKDLLLNKLNNIEINKLYIRNEEKELYEEHVSQFEIEYI